MLGQNKNQMAAQVEDVLTPSLAAMGFDIIRVAMMGGKERPTLQIMAENADGNSLTLDQCAEISKAASAILDVEDTIGGAYILEVSSPGIDRPLTRKRDFERFSGFEAKVEMVMPVDGRRRFSGKLMTVKPDGVDMEVEGQTIYLSFDNMEKAKLLLTDELLKMKQQKQ